VLIPHDITSPLKLVEESTDGGLENGSVLLFIKYHCKLQYYFTMNPFLDSLQRYAKMHFSSPDDSDIRLNAIKHHLDASNTDKSLLTDDMISSLHNMGAQVEIISLSLPSVTIISIQDYIKLNNINSIHFSFF
jgi:hypothetical protein